MIWQTGDIARYNFTPEEMIRITLERPVATGWREAFAAGKASASNNCQACPKDFVEAGEQHFDTTRNVDASERFPFWYAGGAVGFIWRPELDASFRNMRQHVLLDRRRNPDLREFSGQLECSAVLRIFLHRRG